MMNHQTKLNIEIAFHLIKVVFGLALSAALLMLVAALFGHIEGDLAQRDWALEWAAFLGKVIIGFFVAWGALMAVIWVARKIRNR
jgi:hypothetical protein